MPILIDQIGKTITLHTTPHRIVSLVPSQTELLFDLGLENEVVGITKFCVHPDKWFRSKTRVGGTKQIKKSIIEDLKPDLIIANKEENIKEQVDELASICPVWTSDVNNIESACEMIQQIGIMTGTESAALNMVNIIKARFSDLSRQSVHRGYNYSSKTRVAYLIWQRPYMTAGGDTFIHAMLEAAGFENAFAERNRYPEVTIEELLQANCHAILLSSEPFPFKQKHIDDLRTHFPNTRLMLVDGEMFSWYGSRLLKSPEYLKEVRVRISGTRY